MEGGGGGKCEAEQLHSKDELHLSQESRLGHTMPIMPLPPPYLIQNHMGILVHVSLVDQLLQKHPSRHKGHSSRLAHVLVHSNLIANQGAQCPIVHVRHKLRYALCRYTAWLSADDVTMTIGHCVFLQNELWDLSALPTPSGPLDNCHLEISKDNKRFIADCYYFMVAGEA